MACLRSRPYINNAAIIDLSLWTLSDTWKLTHSLSYSRVIRTDWPESLSPKYREGIGYSILLHAKLVVFYSEKQLFRNKSAFFFAAYGEINSAPSVA